MKTKFMCFSLLMLICVSINAQKKIGIGDLYIGMPYDEACQICGELQLKKNFDNNDIFSKNYGVVNYEPVRGFKYKYLNLFFYEDRLYSILIEETTLKPWLTICFGEPKIDETKKEVSFKNTTETREEKEYTILWNTGDDNIVCVMHGFVKYITLDEIKEWNCIEIVDKSISLNLKKRIEAYKKKKQESINNLPLMNRRNISNPK